MFNDRCRPDDKLSNQTPCSSLDGYDVGGSPIIGGTAAKTECDIAISFRFMARLSERGS
jgi:hypothetical protein